MEFLGKITEFIQAIIQYLKNVVAYFRAKNEGKEAELPEFPFSFGDKEETEELTSGV
ncbi:MAG: hypothetical protein IJT27_01250 [Clostridia bacterium]|nr:hypothetical protein [Clostridia bacterium]